MKRNLLKTWLLLCALIVGSGTMWADKITDYNDIISGQKYYIGATTGGSDFYLSVDGSSTTQSIAGTAVPSKDAASVFTFSGSGTSWTIQFESGYYLSLKNSKDNGKVQVVSSAATFTASNQSSKLRLTIGNYSIQKNNSGTQFGSYGNTQTDIWLEAAESTPAYAITAQSNNESWGTVSLSGSTITATPVDGCYYADPAYTVTEGTATVSQDGNIFTVTPSTDCTVQINFAATSISGIALSHESATLKMEGEPLQLTATVLPNDASFKTVTWSSSNEDVATVSDDGLVTAVATGSCTITATATNGTDDTSDDQTATCTVNVTPNYKNISFVTGTDDSDWTISPTSATAGTEITVSYNGSRNVKSFELLKNQPLTETIATGSGISTFTGDNVSITVSYPGNGNENGAWIYNPNNENGTMTISTTNGSNITSVVLTIALYPHNSGMVSATSGTCTVSNGGGTITVSDVNATSVTLSISDFFVQVSQVEVHYNNLVSTDIAVSNTGNDYTFTMPNYDVEIQVEYVPLPYTVTLGDDNSTLTEAAGGAGVILPSRSDIGSYTFAGWSETNMTTETTEEPVIIEEDEYYPTADITLYPVYTMTEGGVTEVVDVLNRELTGITGTNYSTWSGKTATSSAVYAGSSAGGNDAIQLRSNNNNSGIVTTTSGGKAKKVSITWNNSTATGRTVDVYGKNTGYSAATDLYSTSTQGTKLGSIVYETSTELSISGDYEYIGLRSNSGALYIDEVDITWSSGSFTTSYVSTPSVTLTANEGETDEYWATYYNYDYNVKVVSDETQVFKVNLSGSAITMTEIADGIVTKGQGVVLKSNSNSISMTVNASASDDDYSSNSLVGTMENITNPGNAYVLNKKSEGIGFYKLKADGTIGANKAYLVYNGSETREFLLTGEATGIDNVSVSNCGNGEVYDLQGRRVSQPTKGLYIVNGKKVVIK